ncbi:phosphotransferase family protein [Streptomyces sp. NBRC 109706]|uniref:phosphotransferase family protein n=1 Tax=Streptomyces sp. NBRC 109706 TaxID=1550035 RepID=UPI000785E7F2|nr:phosphotransferase [Streptomyces sp. NBRC 109706]
MHVRLLAPTTPPSDAGRRDTAVLRAAALLEKDGHTVTLSGPGEPTPGSSVGRPDLVLVLPEPAVESLALTARQIAAVRAAYAAGHGGPGGSGGPRGSGSACPPVVVAGPEASLAPLETRRAVGADGSLPGALEEALRWLVEACAADPSALRPDRLGRIRPTFGRWDPEGELADDHEELDVAELAGQAAERLGLGAATLAGSGLEFAVFRAEGGRYGDVALRVPRQRVVRYTGRDPFTVRDALEQERTIAAHLHAHGLPVAEPLALVETADAPVLASRFHPGAGTAPAPDRIGELLARLHRTPPVDLRPLDHDGWPFSVGIARRVATRWAWLATKFPDLPPLPGLDRLIPLLEPLAAESRVLHLDVRACNMAATDGTPTALFDWGCAMVGHPALELARIRENDLLPENDTDVAAVLAGYRRHAPEPVVDPAVDAVLRLDGVTMLSVVFGSGTPDPERLAILVDRAENLVKELTCL